MVTIKYNNMEGNMDNYFTLVADAFSSYRSQLFNYISYKIENKEDAEDMMQIVFAKIQELDEGMPNISSKSSLRK